MENSSYIRVISFPQMLYSYVAVIIASFIGLVVPQAAAAILGPVLLLGLVGLGLAHGACDQLVLPTYRPVKGSAWWQYMLRFTLGYLSLAALVGLGWWYWPGATVGVFFLLTVWHWGSADAATPDQRRGLWIVHSLLRGLLLFAMPAVAWPVETQRIINGLLLFAGAAPLTVPHFQLAAANLWPLVGGGHAVLWWCYGRKGEHKRWQTDLLEVSLLLGLFLSLPPLLSLGVYFSFWHSLQHILRLNSLLGGRKLNVSWQSLGSEVLFFSRRSLPLLCVSVGALGILYWYLSARLVDGDTAFSLGLIVASIVTLPHALLVSVVMDARKWQPAPGPVVRG